ncbi:MAG: outer membrane beta-barrel protein [Aquabacterium sp.]
MNNKLSRLSLAAMTCGALCLATAQVHAQSGTLGNTQNPSDPTYGTGAAGSSASGGMSNSMGSPSGANNSAYGNSNLAPLPTEPTSAGYTYGSDNSSRYSWIPYTTAGFIGIGLGNGSIDQDCVAGQTCDDPGGAINIYTGGMFTPYLGMQLGYFRLDDTDRNGGTTKISGVNISLIGVAPLGTQFSLVGRVGGTYGWTDITAGAGVPVATGEEKGFVPAFGAGVSWDFNRNMSLTLDWDRHQLKYPGGDKENTDIATIGLKYRF